MFGCFGEQIKLKLWFLWLRIQAKQQGANFSWVHHLQKGKLRSCAKWARWKVATWSCWFLGVIICFYGHGMPPQCQDRKSRFALRQKHYTGVGLIASHPAEDPQWEGCLIAASSCKREVFHCLYLCSKQPFRLSKPDEYGSLNKDANWTFRCSSWQCQLPCE